MGPDLPSPTVGPREVKMSDETYEAPTVVDVEDDSEFAVSPVMSKGSSDVWEK
jgi:hypothetical protein